MATPVATGAGKRKKRGRGGCCGCLVVLLLLLGGALWLARKWAPNHLNRGLDWGRTQVVTKYPALDRWLPRVKTASPTSVFEPTLPISQPVPTASPAPLPEASPAPSPSSTPALSSTPVPVVGTGAAVTVGQTVEIRYGANKSLRAPERFMLGASEVDQALEMAVRGMRVGGKTHVGDIEIELVKVL